MKPELPMDGSLKGGGKDIYVIITEKINYNIKLNIYKNNPNC